MSTRPPPLAAVILGLHLAWGAVVLLLPRLGGGAAGAAPFLTTMWAGTTAMLLVAGMAVGSAGWQPRETAALGGLLLFDVMAGLLVVRLAMTA